METIGEDAHLTAVYDTEHQRLKVARTRARDFRRVGGVEPASEELEEMGLARGFRAS